MAEKRILIVEDETIVAMTLEESLHKQGYTVAGTVSSADEALLAAEKLSPDLILMDIRIRGNRDGISAAEEINERFNIPIVYLTAHTDEKTLSRAVRTRPYGYLSKPFRQQDLHSTIEIALYKHRVIGQQKTGLTPDLVGSPSVQEKPAEGSVVPPPEIVPQSQNTIPETVLSAQDSSHVEHILLDALDLPVLVLDRRLHVDYYNPALDRLFIIMGYLPAGNQKTIFEIAPATFLGSPKELRDVFDSGKPSQSENTVVLGDRKATFSIRRLPLFVKGNVGWVAVVLKDISRELIGIQKGTEIREGYEELLKKTGEIGRLANTEDTPTTREIARLAGDMVITLAKIDPVWPAVRER